MEPSQADSRPIICLCGSREDRSWLEEIYKLLMGRADRLGVEVEPREPRWLEEHFRRIAEEARSGRRSVLVLLVSPAFLDETPFLKLFSVGPPPSLRVVPLIVANCEWESQLGSLPVQKPLYSRALNRIAPPDLPDTEAEIVERILDYVRPDPVPSVEDVLQAQTWGSETPVEENAPREQLNPTRITKPGRTELPESRRPSAARSEAIPWLEVERLRCSETVRKVFGHAEWLGKKVYEYRTPVTPEVLLFSVYRVGNEAPGLQLSISFLGAKINRALGPKTWEAPERFKEFYRSRPEAKGPLLISKPAMALLGRAWELTKETGAGDAIRGRHLVGAFLASPEEPGSVVVLPLLEEIGLKIPELRKDFLEWLRPHAPPGEFAAWRRILTPADAPREAPPAPEYDSDDTDDDDHLDISAEVQAFAKLIAHRDVKPPLSIGIFGDWGAGKSFFMRQIENEIQRLAEKATRSEKPQREVGYFRRIVQIRFNAWHYVEGNLWASLVEHIFQNLKFPSKDKSKAETEFRELKKHYARQLKLQEEALAQIRAQREEADRSFERARDELDRVKTEQAEALRKISDVAARDYWSVLDQDFPLRARLSGLLGQVPVGPGGPNPGEESLAHALGVGQAAATCRQVRTEAVAKGWTEAALAEALAQGRTAAEGANAVVSSLGTAEEGRLSADLKRIAPDARARLEAVKLPSLDAIAAAYAKLKALPATLRGLRGAEKDAFKAAARPVRALGELLRSAARTGWTAADSARATALAGEVRAAAQPRGEKSLKPADELAASVTAAAAAAVELRTLLDALGQAEELGRLAENFARAMKRAGVAVRSARELNDALVEAGAVLERGKGLLAPLFEKGAGGRRFAALLCVILASPAGGWAIQWILQKIAGGVGEGLQGATTLMGSLATLLAGGSAWVKSQAARVNELLQPLERARQVRDERLAREKARQDGELLKLQKELDLLRERQSTAQRQMDEAEKKVAEARAELENLDPARLLSRFIGERAESADYRKHLGVPALIRRDFESLSEYIRLQNEELLKEGADEKKNEHLRINRIVLYIDDLDRCPPAKVVEVLQAVHLLLAFPLFVVVVAVDVRWLDRSLKAHYEKLFRGEARNGSDGDLKLGATPLQYIEKIFQIPFWMRPIDPDGCIGLVRGLLQDGIQRAKAPEVKKTPTTPPPQPGPVPAPVQNPVRSNVGPPPVAPAGTPKPPEDDGLDPKGMVIHEGELKFIEAIADLLGTSPRGVKRFVNLYRLIKAGLTAAELAGFQDAEGGGRSYRAVLFLLALVTGLPTASKAFFEAAVDPDAPEELDALVHRAFGRGKTGEEVERLLNWIGKTKDPKSPAAGSLKDLSRSKLADWVDRISRYSFRTEWVESGTAEPVARA
jgi:hypothetical protein